MFGGKQVDEQLVSKIARWAVPLPRRTRVLDRGWQARRPDRVRYPGACVPGRRIL